MADAGRHLLITLLAFSAIGALRADARQWVNDRGQRVEGELIRVSKSMAYLSVNGKTVEAPINRLSEADQAYLEAYQQAHKYRDWETRDGESRRARFLRVEGETVTLQFRGEEIELKLSDLMDDEQRLVASVSEEAQPRSPRPAPFGQAPPEAAADAGPPRQWTSNDGKTITARFGGVEGGKVVLLMDGKEFRVPEDRLSAADQAYIARQSTTPPAAVAESRPAPSSFPSMDTDFQTRHEQMVRESRERMERLRAEADARHEQRMAEMASRSAAPAPDVSAPTHSIPSHFDSPAAGPSASSLADSDSAPDVSAFPTPRGPTYAPPTLPAPRASPTYPTSGEYNVIICGKCRHENALPFKAGDKCRKCGTRIDMIENEDGSIQSSSPQYWARNVRGMIFGGIFVASMIGALIKKFS
ncbi:hypothetical protein [Pirellulimonas nuda]|uniref:hypothetical protein n=1 Tax=Pirellulimonas nuda TaxID=2528009 RepID=UPI0011A8F79A|nr:hypothetical protein [Pirellulimonas nuda]